MTAALLASMVYVRGYHIILAAHLLYMHILVCLMHAILVQPHKYMKGKRREMYMYMYTDVLSACKCSSNTSYSIYTFTIELIILELFN